MVGFVMLGPEYILSRDSGWNPSPVRGSLGTYVGMAIFKEDLYRILIKYIADILALFARIYYLRLWNTASPITHN